MILDKKFLGILDQETGVLVVFSKEVRDTTYDDVNETVTAMNKASLSVDCGWGWGGGLYPQGADSHPSLPLCEERR
jgi:hypothetical protein